MSRSTKEAWLSGQGDLKEADVEDVPVRGQSVRVRALSARYSAEVQSQVKMVSEGRSQVAKIDVPTMEMLQFVHGVIEPQFTPDEAKLVQERFGPAFRKVIAKIDEISGIDKEAIEQTEQRFHGGAADAEGIAVGNGTVEPDAAVAAGGR
jgi:hypothetical protein